jgi:post-segregation antitoxin (ccd killing protein)
MVKPRRASGQITYRCPVELHEELLEIATALGVDLSALMSLMIRQALPSFLTRAKEQAEAHLIQGRLFDEEVAIPTEEAVVRQVILAGRQAPAAQRIAVMQDHAERFGGPGDPPPRETVIYAFELMDRAAALHQLRRMRTDDRHHLEPAQAQALEQLEGRITEEIDRLARERARAMQPGGRGKKR